MEFELDYLIRQLPALRAGLLLTVQVSAIAIALSLLVGLLGASIRVLRIPALAQLVAFYVEFIRNTPLLVQIFFIYFALPDFGITLTSWQAVVIGLALNAGAYLTEIQRAGFQSIHAAEIEAAETLGFTRIQTIRHVILPHICKVLFPPLSNQYIILTMTTSIAAIFGVEELTGRTYNANAITFRAFELFSIAAVIYIGLTLIASALLVFVGRRLFRIDAKVF